MKRKSSLKKCKKCGEIIRCVYVPIYCCDTSIQGWLFKVTIKGSSEPESQSRNDSICSRFIAAAIPKLKREMFNVQPQGLKYKWSTGEEEYSHRASRSVPACQPTCIFLVELSYVLKQASEYLSFWWQYKIVCSHPCWLKWRSPFLPFLY